MAFYRYLKNNLLIILVLISGFLLYIYHLSSVPSGIYVDEAVVGYDAYSLLNTVRDHYGQVLPIYFKFFNSYTPGLFVYVEVLFVKIFGLNAFAIRLPSVFSMLSVGTALYWFLKREQILSIKYMGIISVVFFLMSPWTLFNARLGYETTFAFALLSLGILFYKKPILSLTLLSLSTYAGFTERYLAPLIILIIYSIFYFKKHPLKKLSKAIIIALIIQIPNIIFIFTPAFWVKNSFTPPSQFLEHYFSYFSPFNLFYSQDYDLQRSVPQIAVFYSWMFIPWLAGLYTIYTNKKKPFFQYLILLMIVMPLPAALSNVSYSTQRALPLLLPYSIVIAVGTDKILLHLRTSVRIMLLGSLAIFSAVLLWRSYFILFPVERATAWNSGYQQLTKVILENPSKQFVIDNTRGIPDILILFWSQYSPMLYQKENPFIGNYYSDTNLSGQVRFGNVEVRPINWKQDLCKNEVLVGDALALSPDQIQEHNLKSFFDVKDNRGQIVLQGYETDKTVKCH